MKFHHFRYWCLARCTSFFAFDVKADNCVIDAFTFNKIVNVQQVSDKVSCSKKFSQYEKIGDSGVLGKART